MSEDRKDVKGKVDYLAIPKCVYKAYHVIKEEGFKKYGNNDTWRDNAPEEGIKKYLNACKSHLESHNDGEELDPDGGNPHIYKILWNAVAIVWHYEQLVKKRNAVIHQRQQVSYQDL